MVKVEIELEDLTKMQTHIEYLKKQLTDAEYSDGRMHEILKDRNSEIETQKVIITSLEMNNEKLSNAIEEKEAEIQTLKEQLKQLEQPQKEDKYPYPSPIPEKTEKEQWQDVAKKCRCGKEEIENAEKDLEWPEGLQVIAQQTYTSGSVYRGVDLMNNLSKLINVALDETRKGNIAQIVSKDSDNQFIMGIAII
jgi:predicted RNase H-like nuclease (RuvC/YqgF family)